MRYSRLILSIFFLSTRVFTGGEKMQSPEELVLEINAKTDEQLFRHQTGIDPLLENLARVFQGQELELMKERSLQVCMCRLIYLSIDPEIKKEAMYLITMEYSKRTIPDKWRFIDRNKGYRIGDFIQTMMCGDFFAQDRNDIIDVLLKEIDTKNLEASKFMWEFNPTIKVKIIKNILLGKIFPDGYERCEQIMEILFKDIQMAFNFKDGIYSDWQSKWQWLNEEDFTAILKQVKDHPIYNHVAECDVPEEHVIEEFKTNWNDVWEKLFTDFRVELEGRLSREIESRKKPKGRRNQRVSPEIEPKQKLIDDFRNAELCIFKVVNSKKEIQEQNLLDALIVDEKYDEAIRIIRLRLASLHAALEETPLALCGIESNGRRKKCANQLKDKSDFALHWWKNLLSFCESAKSINDWLAKIQCIDNPQALIITNCLIFTTVQKIIPILDEFGKTSDGHFDYAQSRKQYYQQLSIDCQMEMFILRYGNDEKFEKLIIRLTKLSLPPDQMLASIHASELPSGLSKDNILCIVHLANFLRDIFQPTTDHEEISEVVPVEDVAQEISDTESESDWDLDEKVRWIEGTKPETHPITEKDKPSIPVIMEAAFTEEVSDLNWVVLSAHNAGHMLTKCLRGDLNNQSKSIEGPLPEHLEGLRPKEGLNLAILYQTQKESIRHSPEFLEMLYKAETIIIKSVQTHAKCLMLGLEECDMSTSNCENKPKRDITAKIKSSYACKQILLGGIVVLTMILIESNDLAEKGLIIEEIKGTIYKTLNHILNHDNSYAEFLTNYFMERFGKTLQEVKSYSKAWDLVMEFKKSIVDQMPQSQKSAVDLYFHLSKITNQKLGILTNKMSIADLLREPHEGVRISMIMPKRWFTANRNAIHEVNVGITGSDFLNILDEYLDSKVEHLYFFSAVVPSKKVRSIIDRAKNLQIIINNTQKDLNSEKSNWINAKELLGQLRKIPLQHAKGFILIKIKANNQFEVVVCVTSSNFSYRSLEQGLSVENIVIAKRIYSNISDAMEFMQEFIRAHEQI